MPQLDLSTFPGQLFWLAILFALLYLVLAFYAMPRIGTVLDERQRRIDDNLDRAAKLKAEAEAAVSAYETLLADARNEAKSLLRAANEEAAKLSERRLHELGDKLAALIKEADAGIAASKTRALGDIRAIAADLAHDAALRLAGIDIDRSRANSAVTSVLGEEH